VHLVGDNDVDDCIAQAYLLREMQLADDTEGDVAAEPVSQQNLEYRYKTVPLSLCIASLDSRCNCDISFRPIVTPGFVESDGAAWVLRGECVSERTRTAKSQPIWINFAHT